MIETKPLSSVEIDHARARAELPALSQRVAALVRSVPDPEAPIPNSEWRIADAAAHLVCAVGWHIDFARGWHSPYAPGEGAAANAAKIAELGERRPDRLAQLYLERVQAYLEVTEHLPADKPVYFHFGLVVTLSMISCLAMGESMVHTYDIARAAKKPWRIDPQEASLFMGAIAPIMPFLLLPDKISGLTAAFQFKIRGGPSYIVRIQNGMPNVETISSGPADATISLDPVAAFLLLYGRVTQWSLLPAGKVMVWGRRPLLGMRYGSFQAKP
jgi:uncharacterized protein (TIGR03083 family)